MEPFSKTHGQPPGTTMPIRILYVESDEEFRDIMTILIQSMGYVVMTAGTKTEALCLARSFRFDLVLIEIFLIDGSGTELCRQLRARHPGIPVLLMSGLDRCIEICETLDGRDYRYAITPSDPDRLEKAITRSLRGSGTKMRLAAAQC